MSPRTLLVTSIGPNDYEETTYELGGERYATRFSPVAIADSLGADAAFVPRTSEAGAAYDEVFAEKFSALGVESSFAEIPKVDSEADVDAILGAIVHGLQDGDIEADELVLDITHGFRSLPMVFFAAVMQLDALGNADVRGIYYGEFEFGREVQPIIDLTRLHTLMEWYHAFQTFDRTGSLGPVHRLFDDRIEQLFKREEEPHEFASLVKSLGKTQTALDSGSPLEAGLGARDVLEKLETFGDDELVGPEGAVLDPLERRLRPLAVADDAGRKADITLDEAEVLRERAIVDFYRETDRYWLAVECARELMITRALYEQNQQRRWVESQKRQRISHDLSEIAKQDGEIPEVARVWRRIGDIRNAYAHAGFREDEMPSEQKVDQALRAVHDVVGDETAWADLDLP